MRKTYWALVMVAALAIIVNALEPAITQGLESGFLVRFFHVGPDAIANAVYLGQFLLRMTTITAEAMTAGVATFAVAVAAWTGRKGWLAALIIAGVLAIYIPAMLYYPSPLLFMYYHFLVAPYGLLLDLVTPPVVVSALALVFALSGLRQARVPQVVMSA